MPHLTHKCHVNAVVIALLAAFAATFAYSVFVLHSSDPRFAHGLDITGPFLLERVWSFVRSIAE